MSEHEPRYTADEEAAWLAEQQAAEVSLATARQDGSLILDHSPDGHSVDFATLQQIPTPAPTSTFTPIPHANFVARLYRHADELMVPKGFRLEREEFKVAKGGQRMFFVLAFTNSDSEMRLCLAGRNAHDKSMKACIAFGAEVVMCTNLAVWTRDGITIFRKHVGDPIQYLEEQIILHMYRSTGAWDDIRRRRDELAGVTCDLDKGFAYMGLLKERSRHLKEASARILVNDHEWALAADQWRDPQYEYSGGSRSLWAWQNALTAMLRGCKPELSLPKHATVARFTESIL